MSRISVVVPHWNRRDLLDRFLPSLKRQTVPLEVIVVDNGSDDGSASVAASHGAAVVQLDRNYGFAYAVNRGIEAATGSHVAIVNNDVTLESDYLLRLLDANAPFATGKILDAANPGRLDATFDLLSRGACPWRAGHGWPDSPAWNEGRRIQFAPLTAALFRREIFTHVGLLDETFGSYLEDIDFGLRCGLAGIAGAYLPAAIAYHEGSATLGAWHPDTVRLIARNQLLLIARHYPPGWFWQYGCSVIVSQLLWGVLALRHGRFIAWWRGKREGIRSFSRRCPPDVFRKETVRLREILVSSERELLQLQAKYGFETFWKVYSRLT